MNLHGKHVLVIGLGETGLAMAKWLTRQGAVVRVADSRLQPPNVDALRRVAPQAELLAGPFVEAAFSGIDLIAISPGVPVQEPQVKAAAERGIPLVSEIELFAWGVHELTAQAKVIAITGSNGKTTTTALVGALCAAAGRRVAVAGNISPAALDALMHAIDTNTLPEIWVLELSSFQLETTHTLNPDAATVLNVSEDHLDRYTGMGDYTAAKERVFKGRGIMVLNRDDDRSLGAGRCGRKLLTFGLNAAPRSVDYGLADGWLMRGNEKLIALNALKLAGLHNAANAMAALALCEAVGIEPRTVLPALAGFTGLAHRVAFVAEFNGVSYYDDSKGTNVGATLAAVQGMGRKVAIILGGEGKEQDFSPLRLALAEHGRAVALIGRDAGLIAAAIDGCEVPIKHFTGMDEAVRWCAAQAQTGDAVLLSPACASLDMFRNYAHRAEVFIDAVHGLQSETAS
ncbi:UDP-N-acetylmuramoyl-L-alanine--D-glutamate ligase [Propionivibrio sp.]|uniref:UDP-N-acetylmuramoyl-L-alanine--D-glutamate ligase n=1 Tax=Propionivibrio sp. TaxID=2212460 RepID=UPI003BF3A87F